jgi:hypothetical protein
LFHVEIYLFYIFSFCVESFILLSARESLAPVAVIGTDEGTDEGTDDGTDGWKGRPDTTASGQNQKP